MSASKRENVPNRTDTQITSEDNKTKTVGLSSTPIHIQEKVVSWGNAGTAALVALLSLAPLIGGITLFVISMIRLDAGESGMPFFMLEFSIVAFLAGLVLSTTFTVVNPGHTKVVQFFGRYLGTVRRTGINLVPPFSSRSKVSVRVHNFETTELKVNDADGNPVNIAAIVVWQVADTARAKFGVEEYAKFIETQAEAALRHVASEHPYDSSTNETISLRRSIDQVSVELAAEVSDRVALAGLEVLEVRISSLAYAPEIAQAMLQRQQAGAIIAARELIVEGAVTMVETALERLEKENIVTLDEDKKAQMVSNLLVVLCSESKATPVVNAGTLYA